MADLGTTMKNAWVKSMEAIGNAANQLATNTRFKVNEMNLINHRKEILDGFGEKAYALWKDGAALPEELSSLLKEVAGLDEQLAAIRAEHTADSESRAAKNEAAPEEAPAEEEAEKAETAAPAMEPEKEEPKPESGIQGKSNPFDRAPTMDFSAASAEAEAPVTDDAVPTLEIPDQKEMEDTLEQVSQSIDSAMERLGQLGQTVSRQVDQVVADLDKEPGSKE